MPIPGAERGCRGKGDGCGAVGATGDDEGAGCCVSWEVCGVTNWPWELILDRAESVSAAVDTDSLSTLRFGNCDWS